MRAFMIKHAPSSWLRSRRWLWLSVLTVSLIFCAGAYAFSKAGIWLVREDPLEPAQVVVVLSGGLPDRAVAAAEIFRRGKAEEVWLTHPQQPGAAMQQLNLPYAGEDQYNRMVLIAKGVPPDRIRILNSPINNTAEEMRAVHDQLESQPQATVIVVTSKAHTRRVRSIWNLVSRGTNRGRLLVRAAPQDSFDAQHWWRTTSDALSVVREYLGLLNVWAGLPLPHTN
jgi:uncharacterized SAM-binding protein YcdF (DUF218 family)